MTFKLLIRSIWIRFDEGLTLEMSASESLYGGQFTLSTQLMKPNYLVILPPTQYHSFFRNLPPLKVCDATSDWKKIQRGHPQGSSQFCPLLWNTYQSDICQLLLKTQIQPRMLTITRCTSKEGTMKAITVLVFE